MNRPSRLYDGLNSKHIPGLDGLRAISALAVFGRHAISKTIPGPYGVVMFFVLSGFLITWLLLRESSQYGHIALKAFYLRRVRRLFPAYFVYWCAAFATWGATSASAALALGYLSNYYLMFVHPDTWAFNVSWSLSVEEQFYLLWPPLLIWTLAKGKIEQTKRGLCFWIVAIFVYRSYMAGSGFHFVYVLHSFESRSDALAMGCFAALTLWSRPKIPAWLIGRTMLTLACLVTVAAGFMPDRAAVGIGYTLAGGLSALILIQAIALRPRFLELPAVRYMGRISYSFYLFHEIVMAHCSRHLDLPRPAMILAELVFSIAIASASHFLIERPVIQFFTSRRASSPFLAFARAAASIAP